MADVVAATEADTTTLTTTTQPEPAEAEPEPKTFVATCTMWLRPRGYGFLNQNTTATVTKADENDNKADKENPAAVAQEKRREGIFVHRDHLKMSGSQIQSLRPGMVLRYTLKTEKDKSWAENVTSENGEPIDWFRQHGPNDRTIYPDVHTGVIAEFNFRFRRGYILPHKDVHLANGDIVSTLTRLSLRWEDLKIENGNSLPFGMLGKTVNYQICKLPKAYAATAILDSNGQPFKVTDTKEKPAEPDPTPIEELDVPEDKFFKGRVLQCRINQYGFILADEEYRETFKGLGKPNGQIYFSNADIHTDDSPALILAGMRVSFQVSKESGKLAAVRVAAEDGGKVVLPDDRKPNMSPAWKNRIPLAEGKVFSGSVWNYDWDKMWGYVKIDNSDGYPGDAKEGLRREGKSLYFNWKDITSHDRIRGVNRGTRVSFTLYKDDKGVGAANLVPEGGSEFVEVVRRFPPRSTRVPSNNSTKPQTQPTNTRGRRPRRGGRGRSGRSTTSRPMRNRGRATSEGDTTKKKVTDQTWNL